MESIIISTTRRVDKAKGFYMLGEFVGNNPGHSLALNLSLIVDALNGKKAFPQTLGLNHIVLKLGAETFTVARDFGIDAVEGGKIGEEKQHAQRIIKILQRRLESRIPTH
jgi:hypothetical protein